MKIRLKEKFKKEIEETFEEKFPDIMEVVDCASLKNRSFSCDGFQYTVLENNGTINFLFDKEQCEIIGE